MGLEIWRLIHAAEKLVTSDLWDAVEFADSNCQNLSWVAGYLAETRRTGYVEASALPLNCVLIAPDRFEGVPPAALLLNASDTT
jgi:hypothetical protein